MPVMQRYLRVEGVNIYDTVLDTNQLSVIRGGSFMLMRAIEHIAKRFKSKLEPLSTGASSGVFRVRDQYRGKLDDLESEIAVRLNSHTGYRHLTFVVVSTEAGNYAKARESLLAKLRVRQLNCPTQAADFAVTSDWVRPCALQGRRLGTKQRPHLLRYTTDEKKKRQRFSTSAAYRWGVGVKLRRQIYQRICADRLDASLAGRLDFTDDVQALSACPDFPQLDNKVAILYLDGNGFGAIQRRIASTAERQKNFDNEIREQRATLLAELLLRLDGGTEKGYPDSRTADGKLRFETLLWGGDEVLFVVPAWLGFELLHSFFELSQDWHQGIDGVDEPLTHAGGLVFCNAKTPIALVRKLAQKLADGIKDPPDGKLDDAARKNRRKQNLYEYLVLESVDYATDQSIADFRRLRFKSLASSFAPLKPAKNWAEQREVLPTLLQKLPKSQVYRLAQLAIATQAQAPADAEPAAEATADGGDTSPFGKAERRLESLMEGGDFKDCTDALAKLFPEGDEAEDDAAWRRRRWVHLVELWDYIAPRQRDDNAETQAGSAA